MRETSTATIDIENVGPVDEFHYEMTEPGLHVIRGEQGAGKTTILRTVQLAQGTPLDRDVKPTVRDGEEKARAEIAGKVLKIARSVRTEGDLDFDGIGSIDLSTVAWPSLKTADKRDAHRIAALCSLAGVKPSTKAFEAICEAAKVEADDWKEIVFDSDVSDDIVATAGSFKRAIERRALEAEKTTAETEAEAAKLRAQVDGVEVDIETDAETLQADLDDAVTERQQIAQRIEALKHHAERVAEAEGRLEVLRAGYNGPGREEAERTQLVAKGHVERLDAQMQALQDQLSELNREQQEATRAYREAAHVRERAEDHFNQVDDLLDVIGTEPENAPDAVEVATAEVGYRSALAALRAGETAREAQKTLERCKDLTEIANQQGKRGRRLRDAAGAVANVLTDAIQQIPGCPLKVQADEKGNARLVIETDRDAAELFDELSDGERWRATIEVLCQAGRLFVVPQTGFGELSPKTRESIDQLARERGCFILTAIADSGELRAEPYKA